MMWSDFIKEESQKEYYLKLKSFVMRRRQETIVYPPKDDLFKAFDLTPFDDVKVVILGQDPYHGPNQAMGLSFSVHKECPLPKSLINIFEELKNDCGVSKSNGDLSGWARQGVLLLNTLLTVEQGLPLSHQNKGWEIFTDRMIKHLSDREDPVIFLLWGKQAQLKESMIAKRHPIIKSSHPSPLSAYRGFFGSRPFSRINEMLVKENKSPIDWSL